jgi:hypothetical protein
LRVIRAFKSTLEDMEEKRSVHSLHSLQSLRSSRSHPGMGRPLSDISYIDEDPLKTPSSLTDSQKSTGNQLLRFGTISGGGGGDDRRNVRWTNTESFPSARSTPITSTTLSPHRHISRSLLPELPKLVHETSI